MAAGTAVAVVVILSRPVAADVLSHPVVAETTADPAAVDRPARAVQDTGTKTATRH
jgi:hypothetical protein